MAWAPLLLLLSQFSGSLSQPVLTQPPSLSASQGASARLSCTLSSGFSADLYWIYWYQHKPGSPPRYLLSLYQNSLHDLGSGVPRRISGLMEDWSNKGLLLISDLQPEDEADYYCMIEHGRASHADTRRWGSGTKPQPAQSLVL
uniref:Ig-like domain-containing protein n=2 Tax=Macaca mulatta TaxID=9544 RepID=A0A1D5QY14_MACMU|nr:immunoglobulin lambda variable 5-45 [Macaca mulatta]